MGYTIDYSRFTSVFVVPSQVTDDYIRTCSGIALKVLLLVLRHPTQPVQIPHFAQLLGTPLGDVKEALDYWTQQGILREKTQVQDSFPQNQPVYQQQPLPTEPVSSSSYAPAIEKDSDTAPEPDKKSKAQRAALASSHKTMAMAEIEALSHTDHKIRELAEAIQGVFGRPLSTPEVESLISFYTYVGLPPEYILLVCAHCISMGRSNVRTITRTLNEMIAEGIETYEQAETYLEHWRQRGSNENIVKSAFGIFDRRLTTQEKRFVETWFNSFGFDIAMVKLAYERTIDSIGKLSFNYVNSILASWHSKGITTAREASVESSHKAGSSSSKNSVMQSSIDMDELQHFITFGKGKAE